LLLELEKVVAHAPLGPVWGTAGYPVFSAVHTVPRALSSTSLSVQLYSIEHDVRIHAWVVLGEARIREMMEPVFDAEGDLLSEHVAEAWGSCSVKLSWEARNWDSRSVAWGVESRMPALPSRKGGEVRAGGDLIPPSEAIAVRRIATSIPRSGVFIPYELYGSKNLLPVANPS
jgi:hypothetical protein